MAICDCTTHNHQDNTSYSHHCGNQYIKLAPYLCIIQGDQKSLCTWLQYCDHQVHTDFLIILYYMGKKLGLWVNRWEAGSWADCQKFPLLLLTPTIHHRVTKIQAWDRIVGQFNPLHTLLSQVLVSYFKYSFLLLLVCPHSVLYPGFRTKILCTLLTSHETANSSQVIHLGVTIDDSVWRQDITDDYGFDSRHGQKIFLVSIPFRPSQCPSILLFCG